jgi:hypothetical protein
VTGFETMDEVTGPIERVLTSGLLDLYVCGVHLMIYCDGGAIVVHAYHADDVDCQERIGALVQTTGDPWPCLIIEKDA